MNIQLFPGLLTQAQHHRVVTETVHGTGWQFTGYSNTLSDQTVKFWYRKLDDEEFYRDQLLEVIQARTQQQFRVDRVYANGQTHGLSGEMHQDAIGSDGSWFTFLYYVGPAWDAAWGGHTVFHDPTTGAIQTVFPTPNTGVLFDAGIWHQGQEPTRLCRELRVTIAWKLQRL